MTRRKQKPKLERILIVNDDAGDIAAMQARLPEGLQVMAASQAQARYFSDLKGYDLVVLDNDANNLADSKGAETLLELRKHDSNVPIVYTSFQPGWVPGPVYQTRGVSVVRTDEALEHLARTFNLRLREPVSSKTTQTEPQLNIIMTYNTATNYTAGMHSGKLLVVAYDRHANERAKEILGKELQQVYGTFDWRTDRDNIRNVFVYDGVNGGDRPGVAAASLGHDIRMRVNLLACPCDWQRKARFRDSMYANLFKVNCGGDSQLGMIADVILGVQRPDVDYERLPIAKEKILEVAEKFQM